MIGLGYMYAIAADSMPIEQQSCPYIYVLPLFGMIQSFISLFFIPCMMEFK